MSRQGKFGSVLLLLGGLLLAASGFLPPGHDRTHWVVFQESLDMLLHPDSGIPLSFYVYYLTEALGLGYPFLVGILLAAASFILRDRAGARICLTLHALFMSAISAASFIRAIMAMREDDSSWLVFLGAFVLMDSLLLSEIIIAVRGRRSGRRTGVRLVDALNLPPVLFLLILYPVLFLVLRANPNWPVTGYTVGGTGVLFAVAGIFLRRVGERKM